MAQSVNDPMAKWLNDSIFGGVRPLGEHAPITAILFDAGGTLVHVDLNFVHKKLRRAGIPVTRQLVRRAECASKQAIDQRMSSAISDTDESRRHPYFAALLTHLGIEGELAENLLEDIEAAHQRENLWRVMLPSTPVVLGELQKRGL